MWSTCSFNALISICFCVQRTGLDITVRIKPDIKKSTGIDYHDQPEAYRVGKGEQGVLICEPYKTEIGSHWRFKTPEIATESSREIYKLFQQYLDKNDFVGADMARKFLQMGYTRARRYANYKGGRKYDKENDYATFERGTGEVQKAESAAIFYKAWKAATQLLSYCKLARSNKIRHSNCFEWVLP